MKIEVTEDGQFISVHDNQRETVERAMREHPRSNTLEIIAHANGVPENKVQQILRTGLAKYRYRRARGPNNSWCYEFTGA
jgi:DNA-directed RNA polymerase sigma subunit (sigma70/sigma32)